MNFRIDYSKKPVKKKNNKVKIAGTNVAVTGTLPGMTRRQVLSWTSSKYAYYSSVVNNATDYLIAGKSKTNNKSSKILKATQLNIPIIKFEDIL